MQIARKLSVKQAVILGTLACMCVLSACEKPREKTIGTGNPPPMGVAGACSETWSDTYCDSTNECNSGTCTVDLQANGASASAKIHGQNPQAPKDQYICVKPGASLKFQSPASAMNSPNQFVADFGGISPWQSARAYVVGGGSTADTETAVTSSTTCFKYNLYVCNSATAPSLTVSCGVQDPKVIVGQ